MMKKAKWVKVFKNGPSKIFGRQSLKNLKSYVLLKGTLMQIFQIKTMLWTFRIFGPINSWVISPEAFIFLKK